MFYQKFRFCLFSALVLMPHLAFTATDTWEGTSSSDLNTAGNWSPTGVPLSTDEALFDSTIPNINLNPTASADFAIDSFTFDNSAKAFTFAFNNCVLTFNGTAIAGTPGDTTIVSNNINNLSGLSNPQVLFNSSATWGSAILTITNSGEASGMVSGISSGYTMQRQLYCPNAFSTLDGAQLSSVNMGIDSSVGTGGNNIGSTSFYQQIHFGSTFAAGNNVSIATSNMGTYSGSNSGSGNNVGYVGNPQLQVEGVMIVGNHYTYTAVNTGTDSSSGIGSNNVGYAGDYQQELDSTFTAGDYLAFSMSNEGTKSGSSPNSLIGYCDSQSYIGGSFSCGDFFSFTASNTGSNTGSGGSNQIGVIYDPQVVFGSSFRARNNATIVISNTGTDTGGSSSNTTGSISGSQFSVGGDLTARNGLQITATNSGSGSGGMGGNDIGYVNSNQLQFNTFSSGTNTTLTATNSGTFQGAFTTSGNNVGYVSTYQFLASSLQSGDGFTLNLSNSGTDSSSGVGANAVGYVGQTQLELTGGSSVVLGNQATIAIQNTGTYSGNNTASGNQVGYTGNPQMSVDVPFQAGDYFTLTLSNTGNDSSSGFGNNAVGHVDDPQVEFGTLTVGNYASITATNTGINTSTTMNTTSDTTGYVASHQFTSGNFQAGTNLTISATNHAVNPGSFSNVGFVSDSQIYFSGTCTLGDGAIISATNSGTGVVNDSQISIQNGFSLGGKATFQAINTGTVSNHGIFIADATGGGGDVNIILSNTDLYVPATQPTLTIGALNGDSTAIVQSQPQLIIATDSSVNAVFAGEIQNFGMGASSLVIAGTGSQTLSGTNPFTGTTTVQSGTLILNGSLTGELDVTGAGTLKGTGTAGTVVLTNGTIAPGQSIGTIHFSTYTSTGGVYQTEVNGQSQSDLIDVSGTATLSGGAILVSSPDGTYTFQTPYTIVSAGTRSGTYASVTSVSPMLQSYLTYDSQHVYLTLLSDTTAAAKTHNENNVANQLDRIINPNPLQSQLLSEIVSLPSLDDGTRALDSLSGWQYTSDLWVAQTVNGEFVKRLYDSLRPIVTKDPKCCACQNELVLWGETGGIFGSLGGNENAHGFGLSGAEVTMGVQNSFHCDWTVGLGLSYEYDHLDYRRRGGTGNCHTGLAGIYGLYRPSYVYALADLTYGYTSNHMHRAMHVGTLNFNAKSRPHVQQLSFYGEFGGDIRAGRLLLQPFLGITAGADWCNDITEDSASGWELAIDRKNCSLVKSRLGLHLTNMQDCDADDAWTCSVDLAWDKRITGPNANLPGQFVQFGDEFVINGVNLNSNSFDYALTITKQIKRCRVYLQGSGEIWDKAYNVNILTGFQYSL